MIQKLLRFFLQLQGFADRPWYLPAIAFLGGLDLFILIVPTDGLLISYVMLRPKEWVRACILLSLGCAIGSLILAILIQSGAELYSQEALQSMVGQERWVWIDSFVENHGEISLALLALLPIPQFAGIAVAALVEMPLAGIFFSVLGGRLVKYAVLGYAASHAPRLLLKIPGLKKEISALSGPPPNAPEV